MTALSQRSDRKGKEPEDAHVRYDFVISLTSRVRDETA